jgi:5-methylcytosine-specific restriction endonuclease McrA
VLRCPHPLWLFEEVQRFAEAAYLAAAGDVEGSRSQFHLLREIESRKWFDEHAQVAANHRRRVLRIPRPEQADSAWSPRSVPAKSVRRRIWKRDHYHCRYCGLPTIHEDARIALQRVLGDDVIPWGRRNASKHGIAFTARTEYDHVQPASLGGTDDEENLVTACAGCNYGKDRYTLAELGLVDPRSCEISPSNWNGLTSLVTPLDLLPASAS